MATGMASSYTSEVLALGDQRGIDIDDITVIVDNYYTREGSVLEGSRKALLLQPDVQVSIDADADKGSLHELIETATTTSPIHGLLDQLHESRFGLSYKGDDITTVVGDRFRATMSDPKTAFERLPRGLEPQDPPIVRHTGRKTEEFSKANTKYAEKLGLDPANTTFSGSRESHSMDEEDPSPTHMRAICTPGEDGVKEIEQKTFNPRATVFKFRSDEPEGYGGKGRAPSAMAYVATAIAVCYASHLASYFKFNRKEQPSFRTVQDTHFSTGAIGHDDASPGQTTPIETSVFMETDESGEFVRNAIDLTNDACHLHALCRAELDPELTVIVE
jgi:uncharacterized OsmC-like protein